MHWSLDELHDLDADVFDQLVAWATERANRAKGDGESVDMDRVIEQKTREEAAHGGD